MYIFAFHPKFPASPFSHYGQPPRAERTPSAQDSHPERRIVWEISLEAEKQRENGIIRINTWEWFYAIRSETKRLVFHFNPWLWKEKELSITYSPRPPIYFVTLHHLNSNRADGSSLHSGPQKIDGDVRAGTPGRGDGKKRNG